MLRALTSRTPYGVFRSDSQGLCVYVNERWCELTGLTSDEALGDGWAAALHPDDADRVRAEWAQASATGRDSIVEYRFVRPDGSICWIEGFASPLHDEHDRLVGWVGTCIDLTARKKAEEAVAREGERFRAAFGNAPIGMALVSPEGDFLQVNESLCRLVGYPESRLLELGISDVTHPDDLAATLDRRRKQLAGAADTTRIEKRYVRADGEIVWVAVSSTLVSDEEGNPPYSVAQIEDVTQRLTAQAALAEAEERFRRAFDDAPIGMGLVALDGRFLRVNRVLGEITGYGEAELLDRTFQDITHPDDLGADLEQVDRLLAGEIRAYQMEKRYLRPDSHPIWVMLSVSLVRRADGEPLYFVSQIEDISERKRAERELKRLAEHDSLTGLLNRRRFREELQRELSRIRRAPRRAALLFIDVDRFKDVNDSLGHKAGDEVLQGVAQRLVRRLRATDVVARLGGDEFGVLLVDLKHADDARRIAGEIRTAMRSTPIAVSGQELVVTVSIGLISLGEETADDDVALIAADNAMYQAKRNGRDTVALAA
jgi:diguanylate cyclase (GGDEF)-like protein/PAS domain S-box-containing protein